MNKQERDKILLEIYDATLVMRYLRTGEPEVVVKHTDVLSIITANTTEDEPLELYTGLCAGCEDTTEDEWKPPDIDGSWEETGHPLTIEDEPTNAEFQDMHDNMDTPEDEPKCSHTHYVKGCPYCEDWLDQQESSE